MKPHRQGSPFISFFQNTTRRSFIQHQDTSDNLRFVSQYGGILFLTGTNGTDEAERMRINSSGNVGIGSNLSNSGAGLEIYPEWSTDTNLMLHYDRGASAYQNLITRASTFAFRLASGSDALKIDSSGSVGINTTSPGAKLDVQPASNGKITKFGNDVMTQYTMTGQSNHTLTLTCGSYYQAEVIITANQTNGGAYNNLYIEVYGTTTMSLITGRR